MSKKKVAGIERPYTPVDLGKVIYRLIEEGDWGNKACLDYFIPEKYNETEIVSEEFDSFSITTFGPCEGIYTDFFIKYRGKEKICLLTAKTLGESEEYFVKMHEMAAHIDYKFDQFVRKNLGNFLWSGYSISYLGKDGKEHDYVIIGSVERVAYYANELRKNYGVTRVFYMDNYTRNKSEYKF